MNKIVAFDIDEVFFPLREVFLRTANKIFNSDLDMKDYRKFGFFSHLYTKRRDLYDRIMTDGGQTGFFKAVGDSEMFLDIPPYKETLDVSLRLKDLGYKIAIVTSRATEDNPNIFYEDAKRKTLLWMSCFGVPCDLIKFGFNKPTLLRESEIELNGRVELMIEDHPSNVVKIADAGYPVALLDQTYNQNKLLNETEGDENTYGAGTFNENDWKRTLESGLVTRVINVSEVFRLLK